MRLIRHIQEEFGGGQRWKWAMPITVFVATIILFIYTIIIYIGIFRPILYLKQRFQRLEQ